MDPLRGAIHLGLKLTETTLDRALDVVRLADTLIVASAVPPVREPEGDEPVWPEEEQADLDALSATLRARKDSGSTPARRAAARKATSTKATAKKTSPKKTAAKKSTSKEASAKKSTPKKASPTKATAKKSTAKKTAARKTAPATKTSPAKKAATSKRTTTKKTTATKTAPVVAAESPTLVVLPDE